MRATTFEPVWSLLQRQVEDGQLPGFVAMVRHRGHTEIRTGGVLTLGRREPMSDDTVFRIASLTKLVGGVLALQLVEERLIGLDDPIDQWLPEFTTVRVLAQPDAELHETVPAERPILVRDLLAMTAGFGLQIAPGPLQRAMSEQKLAPGPLIPSLSADDYVARVAQLPLATQPGAAWHYHTSSDVLGVLLSRATARPLADLLRERVTDPLGLDSTAFAAADVRRLPTAYLPTSSGMAIFDHPDGAFAGTPQFASLGGGLVSSGPDYLRFLAALSAGELIPAARRDAMTADQLTPSQRRSGPPILEPASSWGYQVEVVVDGPQAGRYGWNGGTGTTAYVDPRRELIALLFTQRLMTGPTGMFDDFWSAVYSCL
jgi:CubicO group peptidase (beta-lactamase class C family)